MKPTRSRYLMNAAAALCLALGAVMPARADYASTINALNPVGYWRLNETTAMPTNRAINLGTLGVPATGVYRGTAVHPAIVPGALVGSTDTAATFDGVAQSQVLVPYLPAFSLNPPFTAELWVNPGADLSSTTFNTPLSCGHLASPRSGWLFYQNNTNWNFRMYNQNTTVQSVDIVGGGVPVIGTWYHLVASYDGTTARLYVNGVEVAAAVPTGFVANTDGPLTIGSRSDAAAWWNGSVDEVAIYTNALAASEILAHYQNGINPSPSQPYDQLILAQNPLVYYRLNEPEYVPVYPTAANSGAWGATANGTYMPGTTTAVPGVPYSGFGANNAGTLFAGINGTSAGVPGSSIEIPPQNLITNALTIVCWVKRNGNQQYWRGLVTQRDSAGAQSTGLTFGEVSGGNELHTLWNIAANTVYWQWRGPVVANAVWALCAAVWTPESTTLYLNTNSVVDPQPNRLGWLGTVHDFSTTPIYIGFDVRGPKVGENSAFNGTMDEVAIFDRALTPAQMLEIYQAAAVPPVITVQPAAPAYTVYEGMTVPLTITVDETASLSPVVYQWTKNGANLPGATATNLVLANVTAADAATYAVVITNANGAVTSSNVTLAVAVSKPMIVQPPQPAVRYVGGKATFSILSAGTVPMSYQWSFNGTPIAGETAAVLTLPNVSAANVGNYGVLLTNPRGTSNSVSVPLTLVPAPIGYGAQVLASDAAAYWRFNETSGTRANDYCGGFNGTNNAAIVLGGEAPQSPTFIGLETTNTAYTFNGSAQVDAPLALDLSPSAFSITAWIKVNIYANNMTVVGKGTDRWRLRLSNTFLQFVTTGLTANNTVTGTYDVTDGLWHYVVAVYDGAMKYIYVDGLLDMSLTASGLQTTNASPISIGAQYPSSARWNGNIDEVALFNRGLTATEVQGLYQAVVTLPTPVEIVTEPASQMAFAGDPATFSVAVKGSAPYMYQWQHAGTNLPGATGGTLTLPRAQYADAGAYTVRIDNNIAVVTSQPVTLTVRAPLALTTFANLTNDLVLHLKFDDDYNDTSGRDNHGTGVGAPPFVAGKIGSKALHYFSELDMSIYPPVLTNAHYVSLGTPADLAFGATTDFSLAYWVRLPAGTRPRDLPILCNCTIGGIGYNFAQSPRLGGWSWRLRGANFSQTVNGADDSINDGNWHHLVHSFTRTGQGVTFLDGVQVDTRPIYTVDDLDTGLPTTIGQDASGAYSGWFYLVDNPVAEADLDDVGIWRRALTSTEAQSIYKAGQSYGRTFDVIGPVILGLQPSGTGLELVWQAGTLQSADNITGPWTPVSGAAAPHYVLTPGAGKKFYRVQM